MIIDFKNARRGDYLYWNIKNKLHHYAIGQILSFNTNYGNGFIYGRILESNFLNAETINFEIHLCQFFTNLSDIDKIRVFS